MGGWNTIQINEIDGCNFAGCYGIYITRGNRPSRLIYIGSTNNLYKRLNTNPIVVRLRKKSASFFVKVRKTNLSKRLRIKLESNIISKVKPLLNKRFKSNSHKPNMSFRINEKAHKKLIKDAKKKKRTKSSIAGEIIETHYDGKK